MISRKGRKGKSGTGGESPEDEEDEEDEGPYAASNPLQKFARQTTVPQVFKGTREQNVALIKYAFRYLYSKVRLLATRLYGTSG